MDEGKRLCIKHGKARNADKDERQKSVEDEVAADQTKGLANDAAEIEARFAECDVGHDLSPHAL